MERGSYVAASGGLLQLRKLEIVNNNMANSNTPGFKRQMLIGDVQTFDQTLASAIVKNDPFAKPDHDRNPGTINVRAVTDFSQGPIKNTGNPLDVALRNPDEFFVVEGPEGPLYTRAGNFTLNREGQLVTPDGLPVVGDGGSITVSGAGARIESNGDVRVEEGVVGRLQVVRFSDPQQLERVGASRFKVAANTSGPAGVDNLSVVSNALEMSNVSVISGVIDIISAQRGFQFYAKSSETIDQMNQVAISRLGSNRG